MNAEEIGYQGNNDKFFQRKPTSNRKPKITLAHLNRLKKMRTARDLEMLMRQDLMQMMYGAPDADDSGGMGF